MAYVSIVAGILALLAYVALLLTWADSSWVFWGAIGASIGAAITGYLSKGKPVGKTGLVLGIVSVVIGVLMILWLTPASVAAASLLSR